MAWIRCPFGCHFELPEANANALRMFNRAKLTCPVCHNLIKATKYQEVSNGAAIDASRGISIPPQDRQEEIEKSIMLRISRLMGNLNWFGYNQALQVSALFHQVVHLLLNSELTSNFPTPRIWAILASQGTLGNMWAHGATATQGYGKQRNEGELQAFKRLSEHVSDMPTGSGRPYYIALSPGRLQQGAAPYYGRSYLVFRNSIKTRCTYTATDSLQMLKQEQGIDALDICNISTLANILMRVSDKELMYLCSLVNGMDIPSPNEFIEAQCWGSVNLVNDVEMIVISEADLARMETDNSADPDIMPAHLLPFDLNRRRMDIQSMCQALRDFCNRSGIMLRFLRLDPDTINSREGRPD